MMQMLFGLGADVVGTHGFKRPDERVHELKCHVCDHSMGVFASIHTQQQQQREVGIEA